MARKKKEEISEDWCFVCKEGGLLLLCEHRDCLKSYHPKCVGKDDSILNSEEIFKCNWHSCLICKKAAKFHCFCCPNAICGNCICEAQFIVLRGIKGFCNNCLTLTLLGEEKRTEDSDGEKVDFFEEGTYEYLFFDYWKVVVKNNEGLKLEHLRKARACFEKGKNVVDDVEEIAKSDTNMLNLTNYESWEWEALEDYEPSRKRKKRKPTAFKRGTMQPRKQNLSGKEYLGWGSKPLIEFLTSQGIDTSMEVSPYDVMSSVSKYVDENKLVHPQRKKTIVCDERLSSLFGKKKVNKHRVCNLLEEHYAKNNEASEDDVGCLSEQSEERTLKPCSKKQKSCGDGQIKEKAMSKGYMASIVAENIKLVFLRKSLVEELLKAPETFEDKVLGSFLRVESDPYDYGQRYSHQLGQVTGIKKLPTKGADIEILFQVSSMLGDISVHRLSEADFTKDECDQLNQKVKGGDHKKLTVVELQEKAKQLHRDITKHWIVKELALLKNRIDRANETGRRREMMEYTERRNLLLLPHEQSRLMNEIPEVKAEEMELNNESEKLMYDASTKKSIRREDTGDAKDKEVTSSDFAGNGDLRISEMKERTQEIKRGDVTSLVSTGNAELSSFRVKEQTQESRGGGAGRDGVVISSEAAATNEELRKFEGRQLIQDNIGGDAREKEVTSLVSAGKQTQEIERDDVRDKVAVTSLVSTGNGDLSTLKAQEQTHEREGGDAGDHGAVISSDFAVNEDLRKFEGRELIQENIGGFHGAITTIDLSSDDDDDEVKIIEVKSKKGVTKETESAEWCCMGPTGGVRGPYRMSILKQWTQLTDSYASQFKVWRVGQKPENGIPLLNAFR